VYPTARDISGRREQRVTLWLGLSFIVPTAGFLGCSADAPSTSGASSASATAAGVCADGALNGTGSDRCVACNISTSAAIAPKVPSVGVVTFTTDLADADRAVIQFGKSTDYGLEAPVAWSEPARRTLLLGMPPSTQVHYRTLVYRGNEVCVSPDATFQTGAFASGAPTNISPSRGEGKPAPGFILSEKEKYSYIVNNVGEVVWAYQFPKGVIRTLLSWDGKYLLARDEGPFASDTGGSIFRVGLDGEGEIVLNIPGGNHHDFCVTPRGIVYIAKNRDGVGADTPLNETCDKLYSADVDGSNARVFVDLEVVFGKFRNAAGSLSKEKCHVNAVRYYNETDSFSVSDRDKDAIGFVSASGEVIGSIGTVPEKDTPNHVLASGANGDNNSTWRVQHGHDLYARDKIVLFSNGNPPKGKSQILHYTISGNVAALDWQYTGIGNSMLLGDVQHLPNGNSLATNSVTGDVHEIDAAGHWVQTFVGLSRGYTHHRPTLYGPPPGR
jgi:hypothetical protein